MEVGRKVPLQFVLFSYKPANGERPLNGGGRTEGKGSGVWQLCAGMHVTTSGFFFFSLSIHFHFRFFSLSFFIRTLGVFSSVSSNYLPRWRRSLRLTGKEKKERGKKKKKKKKRPQAGPGGGRLRFSYHQKPMPSLPSFLPFLPFLTLSRTDGHSQAWSGPITFFFFFFFAFAYWRGAIIWHVRYSYP